MVIEIIDYLFFFWVFMTIAVYVLGGIYERHVKGQQEKANKSRRDQQNIGSGQDWSPYSGGAYSNQPILSSSYNSNQYNASQQPRYSATAGDLSSNQNYSAYSSTSGYTSGEPLGSNKASDSARYSSYYGASSPQTYGSAYGASRSSRGGDNDAAYKFSSEPRQTSLDQAYQQSTLIDNNNQQNDTYSRAAGYSEINDGSIPIATGFSNDCVEWVNQILYLFYTQSHKYGPLIAESVYRSLNEKLSNITSSSSDYNKLSIEFRGINRDLSTRPELTNIRTETESEKSISSICKIYNKRVIFDLAIQRQTLARAGTNFNSQTIQNDYEDSNDTAHYELILENLEGKLKSVAMLSDKLIVVQFMEKPDTKILLRPKYHSTPEARNLINEDTLVNLILQTLTQVVVDLYFGDDPEFPQYKHQSASSYRQKLNQLKGSANEIKRQIKHDFFGVLSSSEGKERKVFTKILRAKNINYNQNVTCLMELDTPYQQAMSSVKQGSNPYWDEHYLFNINDKSTELVLELWDSITLPHSTEMQAKKRFGMSSPSGLQQQQQQQQQQQHQQQQGSNKKWIKSEITANAKFLGLARISIEELRRNPVQKLNLVLQSRPEDTQNYSGFPNETDLNNSVGGELMVELLFLEHAPSSQSPGGIKKSTSANSLSCLQQGDIVSVDRKLTPAGYVITTTTITKPSGLNRSQSGKQQRTSRLDQLSVRNQSPTSIATEQSDLMLDLNLDGNSNSQIGDNQSASAQDLTAQNQRPTRSRSRSRSRSILNAIKKRFSFSRTRSRSVGESVGRSRSEAGSPTRNASANLAEAVSIDSRSRASSVGSLGRAKSMPASRDPNEVPTIVINKSRHSSTASAFTFTHPKSQLVIECTEPKMNADGTTKEKGLLRYYAIPDEAANKSKWRKRGVKLHLFNDHQFVACHLAGSSTCHLCGRVFSRRPGKQGYKCRNCHLLSHKQCHVKVDHNCPYATKDGLELEYIDADPPACLTADQQNRSQTEDMSYYSSSLPRTTTSRPTRTMGAKSISMEGDDR